MRRRSAQSAEKGHLMAGLMVAVTLMMIFSLITFQAWKDVLHRDNEAEMMFRAQDLVRAIQRYRRDHAGQGPTKLEDLMEAGPKGQYYLRQLWTDPLVADGKWGLLLMGPSGSIIDPNAEDTGLPQGQGLGALTQAASPQPAAGQLGGVANKGSGGVQEGLPIAGVKSLCTDHTFRVYNGLSEYSQWWFTYLDLEQAGQAGPATAGGQPSQQPGGGIPGGTPPAAGGSTPPGSSPPSSGGTPTLTNPPKEDSGFKPKDNVDKLKQKQEPWDKNDN